MTCYASVILELIAYVMIMTWWLFISTLLLWYLVICITLIFITLCTLWMQWHRGSSFNISKWHLRLFFISSWKMHILRGSSTIWLDSKWFDILFVSLNCVVINRKCIWSPNWILVLMTCMTKMLMCLSSYEQIKIQWDKLYAWKEANLLERRWWSSKENLYLFSILNLSIGNTVLLRGMRMDRLKMSKCLIEMLTT
jgi:hypothetical protein